MNRRWMFGLLLAISGCAHWTKPGWTEAGFAEDKWRCMLYAQATNDNYTSTRGFSTAILFTSCMEDHGWRKEWDQ